jgi:hypothetical protein
VQFPRQVHHLGVRTAYSGAAKQRDGPGGVEPFSQFADLLAGRDHRAHRGRESAAPSGMGRRPVREVAGQHEHGHTTAANSMPDRDAGQPWHLRRLADQLAEVTALAEQPLGMRLLEEPGSDLLRRDLRGDGQHRHPGTVRVV